MAVSETDIHDAVETLCRSERGRVALNDLHELLDHGAISLDGQAQQAIATILIGVWGDKPGTVMDLIRDGLAKQEG